MFMVRASRPFCRPLALARHISFSPRLPSQEPPPSESTPLSPPPAEEQEHHHQATTNPGTSSWSQTEALPSSSPKYSLKTMPHYRITFSCDPCTLRSVHHISQQGYHHGSVLIACPHCRNRHVISDHLRILAPGAPRSGGDGPPDAEGEALTTVDDVLRVHGRLVKYGTLGDDGKVEFWAEEGKVGPDGGEGISGAEVGRKQRLDRAVARQDILDNGVGEDEHDAGEESDDDDEQWYASFEDGAFGGGGGGKGSGGKSNEGEAGPGV